MPGETKVVETRTLSNGRKLEVIEFTRDDGTTSRKTRFAKGAAESKPQAPAQVQKTAAPSPAPKAKPAKKAAAQKPDTQTTTQQKPAGELGAGAVAGLVLGALALGVGGVLVALKFLGPSNQSGTPEQRRSQLHAVAG